MPTELDNILEAVKGYANTAKDTVVGAYDNSKGAFSNKYDEIKDVLEIERNDAGGLTKGTPAGVAARGATDFLKRYAVPAGLTTLGVAGLAGHMSSKDEKLGESKSERTRRILRNMLIAGGATGGAWLAGAGLKGINDKIDATAPLLTEEGKRPGWFRQYEPGTVNFDEDKNRFVGIGDMTQEERDANAYDDAFKGLVIPGLGAHATVKGVKGLTTRHRNKVQLAEDIKQYGTGPKGKQKYRKPLKPEGIYFSGQGGKRYPWASAILGGYGTYKVQDKLLDWMKD